MSKESESKCHDLAKALAPLLGAGWTYEAPAEPYPTAYIKGPDGRELAIHVKGWGADAGRAEISGRVPDRDQAGKYVEPSARPKIVVDSTRDPALIVEHIKRRLLPVYETAFAAALVRVGESNTYINETRETIDAIDAAVPGFLGNKKNEGRDASIWINDGDVWGDLKVSGGHVSLELRHLSKEHAIVVLKALEKALGKTKAA